MSFSFNTDFSKEFIKRACEHLISYVREVFASHVFLVIASFHRLISTVLTWCSRLRREVGNLGVA